MKYIILTLLLLTTSCTIGTKKLIVDTMSDAKEYGVYDDMIVRVDTINLIDGIAYYIYYRNGE
jgi:hypothetical protein